MEKIYIVDAHQRLVGYLSLRALVRAEPQHKVGQLMDRDPISVLLETDQENVSNLMQRYHLRSIPVVDHEKRIRGEITWDDAFDILEAELEEDMMAIAGTAEDLDANDGVLRRATLRMPWLIITAIGGFIMAKMIHAESDSMLAQHPLLLAFLPLVPALGGNIGIQSATVTVRSIATGELASGRLLQRTMREMATGIILALVLSLLCTLGAWGLIVLNGDGYTATALIIGLSLMMAIVLAAVFGVFIPLGCQRFNIDPAIAAGPFITMLNDISGVGIYLALASLLSHYIV